MKETYQQFEDQLIAKGFTKSSIAINIRPKDGQYCLQDDGQKINVFYAERNIRHLEQSFQKKEDAKLYLFELLKKDQTTRQNFNGIIEGT